MIKRKKITLFFLVLIFSFTYSSADSTASVSDTVMDNSPEDTLSETVTPDTSFTPDAIAEDNTMDDTLAVEDTSLVEASDSTTLLGEKVHELDKSIVREDRLEKPIVNVADEISKIDLSPEHIDRLPSIGEADISRVVQLLPGVSGANESTSGLFVRGGSPDQNLILLDGCTIFYVDHFYGFFSPFNPKAIADVCLYKGGFPAQYGSRASSVMVVNSKTPDFNTFKFGGSLNFLSANAHVEIPLFSKGSILVAARRSYSDVIESSTYKKIFGMLDNGNYDWQNDLAREPSFHFYDFNGKISLASSAKDSFSFNVYIGEDQLYLASETADTSVSPFFKEEDDTNSWGNQAFSLVWERTWNEKFNSNFTLSRSRYFTELRKDMNISTPFNVQQNKICKQNNVIELAARINTALSLNRYNTLMIGADVSRTDIKTYSESDNVNVVKSSDTSTVFDDTTVNQKNIEENYYNYEMHYSPHIQDVCTFFNDKLTMVPGLRATYYTGYNEWFFDPRISLQYKVIDKLVLKGAIGKYHQFIHKIPRESALFDIQGNVYFWFLADKDPPVKNNNMGSINIHQKTIPVTSSDHFILGLNYDLFGFLLNIEAYRKNMKGLTLFRTFEEIETQKIFLEGTGVSRGVEFLLKKTAGGYSGWLAYTLSKIEHTFTQIQNGKPFPADHDRPHEINFVNMYTWKISKVFSLDFSGTWIYATGAPYTKLLGEYQMVQMDGSIKKYKTMGVYSSKNAARHPDYHRLDLSMSCNFLIANKHSTSIGLSVFNVYNQKNIWKTEYEIDTKNNLIETDIHYMGITITPCLFLTIDL